MTSAELFRYIDGSITGVTMSTLIYRGCFKRYGVKHIELKEFNMELKING